MGGGGVDVSNLVGPVLITLINHLSLMSNFLIENISFTCVVERRD